MYEHMFVIIRNILRSLMLNFKLKYEPWKTIFHPILISFFGLIQNITALFKIWMKQKHNNLNGRLLRMQDVIKLMPRVKELEE